MCELKLAYYIMCFPNFPRNSDNCRWNKFLSIKYDRFSEYKELYNTYFSTNFLCSEKVSELYSIEKLFESIETDLYSNIAYHLLSKGILHLHCSFVFYKGNALLFSGPSGIGKTTQAELWRDFQGARIINGDAALLRQMEDGKWWAFGTPVHGSSPYCENEQAPIVALVMLKQDKENKLAKLDSFSAVTSCLPEFYRPQMDEETAEVFWKSVDSLFREVPVYRLTCRPDREATELVKQELFKE